MRLAWLALALLAAGAGAARVRGSFDPEQFFSFLVKFGFQKSDAHARRETSGFLFGNATARGGRWAGPPVTLAVLDRARFLHYYASRRLAPHAACAAMLGGLAAAAFHPRCNPPGRDLLRRVPCPRGALCPDEDAPWNLVRHSQFTYVVQNDGRARFLYVSMVACYMDEKTCTWHHYKPDPNDTSSEPQIIDYDIWLVNGNPNQSLTNTLTYQFSFDRQNTFELYLLFWLCYVILLPVQIYAVRTQRHPVTRLFTCSLILEFVALCFIVLHTVKFAVDGEGFPGLSVAGDILDIMSRTIFMLLLLLLAKGWAVTRLELTWKPVVFGIWLCYGIVHILLYIWNQTEVDIIEEIDEYQTWPGWLMLGLRVVIMAWFVYELRNTMFYEHNMAKLNFLLHFGASSLVWFVYLPVIALIALQISPLWRYKFLLGITYSADCLAFCVMAHLLWPTRSEQYLLLTPSNYTAGLEELDEFSESPHMVHSDTAALTAAEPPDDDEVLFSALNHTHNGTRIFT